MKIKKQDWIWHGHAGHYICSDRCLYHLTTEIGNYMVSTVGDFYLELDGTRKQQNVGNDRYETMVFTISGRCDCGCNFPTQNGQQLQTFHSHTPLEAHNNHLLACNLCAEGEFDE